MAEAGRKLAAGTLSAAATAAILAAVGAAAPLTTRWEGYRGRAYYDPSHILTQCYGETKDVDPSRIYSRDECAAKLRRRMAADYAPVLARCMPALVDPDRWRERTKLFGALLDASYNAGPGAVCTHFKGAVNAGRFREACDSLPGWYVSSRNRKTGVRVVYRGLVNRRRDERTLCLESSAK